MFGCAPTIPQQVPGASSGRLAAVCLALLLSGCSNIGYYLQSVGGQLDLWRRERPIEAVLADPATPDALRRQLRTVQEVRDYASRDLALPDNRSYRDYADLERPYVVWNIFATEEFSVEPVQWCFLVVGCVSYRGYFDRGDAERAAAAEAGAGRDAYVGPVPAYSTLGWFPDPVLNTFVHYPDYELARLIFHELAHQVVYVRGDTAFNESFAVTVEDEGVRRWLRRSPPGRRDEYERMRRIRAEFGDLVRRHRERLAALYRAPLPPDEMRVRKRDLLAALKVEYLETRERDWGGYAGYDAWFGRGLNNAQLASVAIYTQLVPAFRTLLAQEGGDLPRFYAAVRTLAGQSKRARDEQLAALAASPRRERQPVAGVSVDGYRPGGGR